MPQGILLYSTQYPQSPSASLAQDGQTINKVFLNLCVCVSVSPWRWWGAWRSPSLPAAWSPRGRGLREWRCSCCSWSPRWCVSQIGWYQWRRRVFVFFDDGYYFLQKCHSNLSAMSFQDLRGRREREKSTHYICYGVVAYDKRKRGGRFRFW